MEQEIREEMETQEQPEAEQAFQEALDRALTQARAQWEQEARQRTEEARQEGLRMASMTQEERLAQREAELSQREKEILRRELRAEAMNELARRGLPAELAEALCYEDEEACRRSIEGTDRAFRQAVQAGVTRRLGDALPPRGGAGQDPASMSDEAYYAARMR